MLSKLSYIVWTKIVDDHGFIIIGFIAIISSSISIFYVYYIIMYLFCVNCLKSPINLCYKLLP